MSGRREPRGSRGPAFRPRPAARRLSGSGAAKPGSASRVLPGLKRVSLDSVEVCLESNIWHLRLMGLRHRPEGTLFSLGRVALLFAFLKLSCTLVDAGRRVRGHRTTATVGTILPGKGRAACQRAASFGVHDGDDGVVEAAPRAHQGVFQMEKPVAEPGAVVAGRIAGQAHDRVPQFGEAFRQILHVAGSLACAGPCFRQEPAGIVPASPPLC